MERKTVGRHIVFIIVAKRQDVSCQSETVVRYWSKLHTMQINTVLIHNLLREMSCGPAQHRIVMLESEQQYCTHWGLTESCGVITEEIPHLVLASQLKYHSEIHAQHFDAALHGEVCKLTIIGPLGQMALFPSHPNSWRLSRHNDDQTQQPSALRIVNVTSAACYYDYFVSKEAFVKAVRDQINCLRNTVDTAAESNEITEHWTSVWWLRNKQKFVRVVQAACDQTFDWIHSAGTNREDSRSVETQVDNDGRRKRKVDDVGALGRSPGLVNSTMPGLVPLAMNECAGAADLCIAPVTRYHHLRIQHVALLALPDRFQGLYYECVERVQCLDSQLELLCAWFPWFPECAGSE